MFPVHSTDMGSSSSSHYLPFNQIAPMFETIDHRKHIGCYYENFPLGIINNNISESFNESSLQNNTAATPCIQYGVELRNNYLADDGLGALDQCHHKRVGSVFLRADRISEKKHQRMIRNRQSAARSRARKLAYEAQQRIEIMKYKKENELLRKSIQVVLAMKKMKRCEKTLKRTSSGPL